MKKKHFFTAEMDADITKTYQEGVGIRSKRHTGYLKGLSQRIGIPPWRISKRAVELGILPTQKKEPNWTDRELKILELNSHLSLSRIKVNLKKYGFARTEQGIYQKRKSMRFVLALNDYNVASIAMCFGVDAHTVKRWIERKLLKSQKREGSRYYIKRLWIKKFIVENVSIIDFRKIDKYWLVDLLTN